MCIDIDRNIHAGICKSVCAVFRDTQGHIEERV